MSAMWCKCSKFVSCAGGGSNRKPAGETRGKLLPSAPAHDSHAQYAAHGKPGAGSRKISSGVGTGVRKAREQAIGV